MATRQRTQSEVTRVIEAIEHGDRKAADELLPLVYAELRRLAARRLADEPAGQTLQPTALVHEAYIRLVGRGQEPWNGRAHFFGAAAEAMRRILVDRARQRAAQKRGGDWQRVELREDDRAIGPRELDLIALDEALDRLAAEKDGQAKAKMVKLRFFAGLSIEEAAEALGISVATAVRYWTYARARLYSEIHKGDEAPGGENERNV